MLRKYETEQLSEAHIGRRGPRARAGRGGVCGGAGGERQRGPVRARPSRLLPADSGRPGDERTPRRRCLALLGGQGGVRAVLLFVSPLAVR